jgi:hypothetical protein
MVSSTEVRSGTPGAMAWLSHRRAGSGNPAARAGSNKAGASLGATKPVQSARASRVRPRGGTVACPECRGTCRVTVASLAVGT